MKAALRPALPLLIGIALAGVLALVAMHSLTFGPAAVTVGSPQSVVAVAVHAQGDAGVGHDRDAHATVGEAVGLVHDVPDAATVLAQMHTQAQTRLG